MTLSAYCQGRCSDPYWEEHELSYVRESDLSNLFRCSQDKENLPSIKPSLNLLELIGLINSVVSLIDNDTLHEVYNYSRRA